ncbi:unnamed protein product, partial [Allacma fusca]
MKSRGKIVEQVTVILWLSCQCQGQGTSSGPQFQQSNSQPLQGFSFNSNNGNPFQQQRGQEDRSPFFSPNAVDTDRAFIGPIDREGSRDRERARDRDRSRDRNRVSFGDPNFSGNVFPG